MPRIAKLENDNFELEVVLSKSEHDELGEWQKKFPKENIFLKAFFESPFYVVYKTMKEDYWPLVFDQSGKVRDEDKEKKFFCLVQEPMDESDGEVFINYVLTPENLIDLRNRKKECNSVRDYSEYVHRSIKVWLETKKLLKNHYLFLRKPYDECTDLMQLSDENNVIWFRKYNAKDEEVK